jgi:hypothetical protein
MAALGEFERRCFNRAADALREFYGHRSLQRGRSCSVIERRPHVNLTSTKALAELDKLANEVKALPSGDAEGPSSRHTGTD